MYTSMMIHVYMYHVSCIDLYIGCIRCISDACVNDTCTYSSFFYHKEKKEINKKHGQAGSEI